MTLRIQASRLIEGDAATVHWLLRLGVAMCFVGHGAFGIITKGAWLPYFELIGISEPWPWRLMPIIGTMDIIVGFLALAHPCRALFAWAAAWTIWTALLRPLAGEGWSEFFERAGNYGVPLTLLVLAGLRAPWFATLCNPRSEFDEHSRYRVAWMLRLTTASLLAGHAGCGVILCKASLAQHYAIMWPNAAAGLVPWVGGFELLIALVVLARPAPALLMGVVGWKLATEMLFFGSGAPAPIFEVIERGGSYVAPLALALVMMQNSRDPPKPVGNVAPQAESWTQCLDFEAALAPLARVSGSGC